ncbi:hypothetical protein N431DRAFT_472161 [Stipitochalara longipes BDJ]|nr:hypothetical protein N431DRAFT_472161 [Stipitochalara longipes BDJ]
MVFTRMDVSRTAFLSQKLVFEGQTISLECSVATWHEDNVVNTITECNDADESHMSQTSDLFTKQKPNITAFGHLLSVYDKREFTYSADILDALDGILSSLTAFEGGFVWGLPYIFFDLALLWQPEETIIRRTSNTIAEHDVVPLSWTWAGWHGELDTKAWERGLNEREAETIRELFIFLAGESKGKITFVPDRKMPLSLGKYHPKNRVGNLPPIYFYSLVDSQGKWAGSLRPHYRIPVEEIPCGASEHRCELVSISQGSVANDKDVHSGWIDEWYLPERPN